MTHRNSRYVVDIDPEIRKSWAYRAYMDHWESSRNSTPPRDLASRVPSYVYWAWLAFLALVIGWCVK